VREIHDGSKLNSDWDETKWEAELGVSLEKESCCG